jgi:hypothetical protein
MKRIFVPTESGRDWKRLLAKPDLHWKPGRSAMSVAGCWEDAADRLPVEIATALERSGDPDLEDAQLLLAVPEWEVVLPGGVTTSHTDVLALVRNERGLIAMAVEAKVDEEFGPTVGEKRRNASDGQTARLAFLEQVLRLEQPAPDALRYQLLHRTASAILAARSFHAHVAVMLVQSFSATSRWRQDFLSFCQVLGVAESGVGAAVVPGHEAPRLFIGWCAGDRRFCEADLRTAV